MTPEQKRAMAIGRANARARRAAQAERSRGHPASFDEERPLPAERKTTVLQSPELAALEAQIENYGDGRELSRESRVAGTEFDIPTRGRRDGWDYQWWPTHVIGQEVDPAAQTEIARGGWRPVPASHFPSLCPPGWSRATIDRQGQRMFMRPMRLTQEAIAEQKQMAYEQKASRLAAAQAGDGGREFARRVNADGSPAAQIDVSVRPLL